MDECYSHMFFLRHSGVYTNVYLKSLIMTAILLFLCYISNRTDIVVHLYAISTLCLLLDAFCHHSINECGRMDGKHRNIKIIT